MNKKYNFLGQSEIVVDLCAAPGGWLQVASKYMPVTGTLIGVDLVPIKPVGKAIMIQADITTMKCRSELKKAMKSQKADLYAFFGD